MQLSMLAGLAGVALLLVGGEGAAQAHPHPADSSSARIGTVHFETSCAPAVAPKFDQAVSFLHSFEVRSAIGAFREVLAGDSTCAMAHWGIALSRWANPMATAIRPAARLRLGQAAVDSARRLHSGATPREREYVEAVAQLYADYDRVDQATRERAYERAMDQLVARHPSDTEAKVFHAIALIAAASPTDQTYANQRRAGETLERLWQQQPEHPGLAHYIIHAYDHPPLAEKAQAAARRYAQIAPSAPHALHMPSHTFTRAGMWEESVATNLRAIEAARQDTSEQLHAWDYAVYAYLQMRRDSAAKEFVDRVPTRVMRFEETAIAGAAPPSAAVFAIAAIPARYALERRDWARAAALEPRPSAYRWTEAMVYFARGLGASHTGDFAAVRAALDSLSAIREHLQRTGEDYWADQVGTQHLSVLAWLDHAEQRPDSALARMGRASDREDASEKATVTPGSLAPARELLGDMLLELKRPVEALAEYRAVLLKEPNRYRSVAGARDAAAASGDRVTEALYAAQLRRLTGSP